MKEVSSKKVDKSKEHSIKSTGNDRLASRRKSSP